MRPTRTLPERLLALALAAITAFSSVPTQALAEAADAAGDAAGQEQQVATGSQDAEASSDVAAGADVAVADASDGEKDAEPAGDDATAESDASGASMQAADANEQQVATYAAADLSSSAKLQIQDSKNKNSSYSAKKGALSVGETLWANMYDVEDPDDYWSNDVSVANPGDWSYTWLAGTEKSGDVSSYTEVVGHEQSLVVTGAMTGKYFICKVTANGKDYYGPAKSYGSGVNVNYIPGPVLAAGQAELYNVKLNNTSPAVGDTLTATAYTGSSTEAGDAVNVTYTWSYADSSSGTYTTIDGETGNTLKLTDAYKNKYIKVEAKAGFNTVSAKTSEAVLAEGAIKLGGVELKAPSTEIGATLTAKAYTGSSYSPTYVDSSKVTYTWKKYKGSSAPSSYTTWETIAGASGPTLTVTNDLEGYYVTVSANAGANDVTFGGSYSPSYVGPFKLAGAVDIYSVILALAGTTSGTYVYTADETVQALAKEKGASTYIDADKLNYQWQAADSKNGTYTDIAGATGSTLRLAAYEGKYIKCVVRARIGDSSYTSRATNMVAPAGSINITSVTLDASDKVNVGDTITATAKASTDDVSDDEHVAWQWYYGDSASSCDTKIEGATGRTLTVDGTYLGKYIKACANGGFGDESTTAGPVVEPGAVALHHVELSGSAKVGVTLTAKAYVSSYTQVSAGDKVHYQWQYADAKTTSDSAFKDIEGAEDSATFTVTEAQIGKYIRVKATSDGSVVSTYQKGSYSSSYVDPFGPVTLAGQYTLSKVEIKDDTSVILQSGRIVTPQAKVSTGYYDKDAPEDAKLTYTWYAKGAGDSDWAKVADGVAADGTLTINDALIGKSLKVTASALDNTVEWVSGTMVTAAGEYDLLRVITNPQSISSTTKLIAGDEVTAEAQSLRADGSDLNGVKVTDGVSFAWYVSDTADGEFTKLDGIEGAKIVVPDVAANKYLKVVATSGSSSVETVFANPVMDRNSLGAVVQKLGSIRPVPVYGEDTNINDVLEAKISELGFEGVTAKVKSVSFGAADAKATVGISADDATNGDITYFYMDPNDYSGWNFDALRRATVTFELSKDGETAEYAPGNITLPWNEDMLQQRLDNVAADLAISYTQGDSADSVTGNVSLPYRAGSAKKFEVTWESSSDQVKVSGYGWSDYTGTVTRAGSDRDVTLTATVKLLDNAGGSDTDVVGTAAHTVTVKGDPGKVAADKARLQALLDANFTYENVKYSGTDDVASKDGLTDDLQMPTTRTLGVDGKYYKVEYSASTDDVTFNGYRGTVYQPQPGEAAAATKITLTVTDKSNREVTATKTLGYMVAPQDEADLDATLSLMEQAKAGYAQAILNGQDAKSVTGNMHAFQKAYLDADGKLAWSYDRDTTDSTASGIVPVELAGYDDMGTQGWRLFKSSNNAIVQHENLNVAQPEYNTKVTISSRLSSEKYARYAERYPDNEKYALLANQDVSATVTVKGTSGIDDPNEGKDIVATAKVVGPDAEGNSVEWVPQTEVTIPAGETMTAAELTKKVLEQNGMTCDEGMWTISAQEGTTLPNGATSLGSAQDSEGNWLWWVFYVNGQIGDVLATNYYVKAGDVITWVFGDGTNGPTVVDGVVVDPTAKGPDWESDWSGYTSADKVTDAPVPTEGAEAKWVSTLKDSDEWNLGVSDPLLVGDYLYVAVGGKLYKKDVSTGQTVSGGEAALVSAIDSTSRMVYANGLIIVPLSSGRLQALTADTLTTRWVTDPLPRGTKGEQQSISSVTVRGGFAYFGAVDADWSDSYGGYLLCVRISDGKVMWCKENPNGKGYYWSGMAFAGSYGLIADDSGTLSSLDPTTGDPVDTLKLAERVRSTVVVDGQTAYVVSADGCLHKVEVGTDGKLSETGKVRFGYSSTSTPVLVNGKIIVGGTSKESFSGRYGEYHYGQIAVIDAATLEVENAVYKADGSYIRQYGYDAGGDVKSQPVVSVQNGKTYVYFTSNCDPGCIYRYCVGDAEATILYTPDADGQNYCMASICVGADGSLYYTNDSGKLFAIKGAGRPAPVEPVEPVEPADPSDPTNPAGPSDSSDTKKDGEKTSPAISLTGNSGASDGEKDGQPQDAADASDEDTAEATALASGSAMATSSSADTGAETAAAPAQMPVWPFVGIGLGVLAILLVILLGRRKREDEE